MEGEEHGMDAQERVKLGRSHHLGVAKVVLQRYQDRLLGPDPVNQARQLAEALSDLIGDVEEMMSVLEHDEVMFGCVEKMLARTPGAEAGVILEFILAMIEIGDIDDIRRVLASFRSDAGDRSEGTGKEGQ